MVKGNEIVTYMINSNIYIANKIRVRSLKNYKKNSHRSQNLQILFDNDEINKSKVSYNAVEDLDFVIFHTNLTLVTT